MPALDFVRAQLDHFQLSVSDASDSYTLYAVLDQRSAMTDIQVLLTSDDTTSVNKFFTLVDPPGGGVNVGVQDGTSYRGCMPPVPGPQWLTWRLDAAAASLTCVRSDGAMGTTVWAGVWSWSSAPLLGAYKTGSHAMDALLSEVILYNRLLSDDEHALLEGYLRSRYGLGRDG